jgi:hypothetical protein
LFSTIVVERGGRQTCASMHGSVELCAFSYWSIVRMTLLRLGLGETSFFRTLQFCFQRWRVFVLFFLESFAWFVQAPPRSSLLAVAGHADEVESVLGASIVCSKSSHRMNEFIALTSDQLPFRFLGGIPHVHVSRLCDSRFLRQHTNCFHRVYSSSGSEVSVISSNKVR